MLLTLLKVITAIIGLYAVVKLVIWVYGHPQGTPRLRRSDVDDDSTDGYDSCNHDGLDSGFGDGGGSDGGGGD